MTEHKHPNYMGIFWILLSVTVVEVGYSTLKVPRPILILGLVSLAGFKALLVALTGFGYRAANEWQSNAAQLIERRQHRREGSAGGRLLAAVRGEAPMARGRGSRGAALVR